MKFNVNNHVRVKLTPSGKKIHRSRMAQLLGDRYPYDEPEEDYGGWSRWQMHDLMFWFGADMYLGCDPPFETEIELEDGLYSFVPKKNETCHKDCLA